MQRFITRRGLMGCALILGGTTKSAARSVMRNAAAWLTLPPTPNLPSVTRRGHAQVNGTSIFFAQFGKGPAVLLLHGGLANSNYWGNQIEELSRNFSVTVMDTRGHGRSPLVSSNFSYTLFAGDVI